MQTIQIIRTNEEVKEPTKSEVLYKNATNAQETLKEAQKALKIASIEGIKDLLNKLPNKSYNLTENDIFIASYTDEYDYNTIMVSSVYLDKHEGLHIVSDNDSDNTTSFTDSDLLYSIYSSMYVKYICGKL